MAMSSEVRDWFVERAKRDIESLNLQIEHLTSGKMRFWSQTTGEPRIETTQSDLEDCKRRLDEAEERLERLMEIDVEV